MELANGGAAISSSLVTPKHPSSVLPHLLLPLGHCVPSSCEQANLSAPGVFSLGEVAHFRKRRTSVCTEGRPRFSLENVQVLYIEEAVLSVIRVG